MRKARYPTSLERDFEDTVLNDCKSLISRDLSEIYQILEEFRARKDRFQLVAVLRYLIELPIDEKTVVLMGWFTFNELVAKQTLYLYMNRLGHSVSTESGCKHMILFARSIFPKLNKYHVFAKQLLSIPGLQFREPHLHAAVTQVTRSLGKMELTSLESMRVVPEETKKFDSQQVTTIVPFSIANVFIPPFKHTLLLSVEFAKTLPEDQKLAYCIRICLGYQAPVTSVHGPTVLLDSTLLKAACCHGITLLYDSNRRGWDAYEVQPQLERLGAWIGALSVLWDRPPPLYYLNIPKLLREAVSMGIFMHALVFVKAIFSRLPVYYAPPNPLTVSILEIVAAVQRSPRIRQDVRNMILSFGEMLRVDVSLFYRRDIELPLKSSDCISQFLVVDNEVVFQKPTSFPDTALQMAPETAINEYFHYVLDKKMLPPELYEMFENAKRVEQYYFVPSPRRVSLTEMTRNRKGLLQCLFSLALADCPILAKLGSALFAKATKKNHKLDITPVFRCAFPNRYILSACMKRRCVNIQHLSVLFAELLTNPDTMTIARPMIESFMPICLENTSNQQCAAIRALTKYITPESDAPIRYLSADPEHAPLLKSFINLARHKSEETMNEFIKNMTSVTADHMESLFSLTFGAAKKRGSPRSCTKIDYSAIDGLCSALGKCTGRVDMNQLATHCFAAAESMAAVAIRDCPLSFFRLINGLFTCIHIRQKETLMNFLTAIGPGKYPTFTSCWIQLVMHRIALPQLIRSNDYKPMKFCVDFVCTCLKLATTLPEGFYHPVVRILMTIAACAPMFFISYHAIIIETLPIRFIQLRNIILSAVPPRFEENMPPPVGFNYKSTVRSKAAFCAVIDPLLITTDAELAQSPQSNAQFISPILGRAIAETKNEIPKIIWQFVIYCIVNITNNVSSADMHYGTDEFKNIPIVELFVAICNSFYDDTVKYLFEAIADNVRYPNAHTDFASNLLFVIFEASDSINREIMITVLMRRLLCVTSPPAALRALFTQICEKYEHEITEMLREKKEDKVFEQGHRIIASLRIKKTNSGRL